MVGGALGGMGRGAVSSSLMVKGSSSPGARREKVDILGTWVCKEPGKETSKLVLTPFGQDLGAESYNWGVGGCVKTRAGVNFGKNFVLEGERESLGPLDDLSL